MRRPIALLISALALTTAKYACDDATVHLEADLGFGNLTYVNVYTDGPEGTFGPLGTQYNSSSKFVYNYWAFVTCSNLQNHSFPPGFQFQNKSGSNPHNIRYVFGQFQRADDNGVAESECAAVSNPRHVNGTGTVHDLLLENDCSTVDQRRSTFILEDHDEVEEGMRYNVYWAAANATWVLGNGPHRLAELVTGFAGKQERVKQLAFAWAQEEEWRGEK